MCLRDERAGDCFAPHWSFAPSVYVGGLVRATVSALAARYVIANCSFLCEPLCTLCFHFWRINEDDDDAIYNPQSS